MTQVQILNKKIFQVGNSYYMNIPKTYISNKIININNKYNIIISFSEGHFNINNSEIKFVANKYCFLIPKEEINNNKLNLNKLYCLIIKLNWSK